MDKVCLERVVYGDENGCIANRGTKFGYMRPVQLIAGRKGSWVALVITLNNSIHLHALALHAFVLVVGTIFNPSKVNTIPWMCCRSLSNLGQRVDDWLHTLVYIERIADAYSQYIKEKYCANIGEVLKTITLSIVQTLSFCMVFL